MWLPHEACEKDLIPATITASGGELLFDLDRPFKTLTKVFLKAITAKTLALKINQFYFMA